MIETPTMVDLEFLQWLKDSDHSAIRPLPGRRYAALRDYIYTCAIITGQIGDRFGFDNRWCYRDSTSAGKALEAWDGTGEPQGWHRHPGSGRRRLNGDATQEYINW